MRSSGIFQSRNARDHLLRLAKHFSHKVEVHHDLESARIHFSCGRVLIAAEDARLRFEILSPSVEARRETENVVESHLQRFAFREAPVSIAWTRVADLTAGPTGNAAEEPS